MVKVNKANAYSPYKAVHYLEKLNSIENGEIVKPVFVQWDLTNVCNLNCSFCFYRNVGFELEGFDAKDVMSFEMVSNILSELSELGIKGIEWTGGGEPLLCPHIREIFLMADGLGFKQALVTNGLCLEGKLLDAVAEFEWVRFSIDASSEETYKQLKGSFGFERVIKNLKALKEVASPTNVIGASFIVCRENYKDIVPFCKLCKSLGIDNVRYSLAMTPQAEKLFDGIWEDCVKNIEEAKRMATNNFTVFSFSNRINDLAKKTHSEYCYYHHLVGVITPKGVYPCCRLKYNDEFKFGSLEESTFSDIWYGRKRQEFIKTIRNGCFYDCWMTEKNKFAKYLLEDNPIHVEFI